MGSEISKILEEIAQHKDCVIHTPAGLPELPAGIALPADVQEFYELCGGVELFSDNRFPYSIVAPEEFVASTTAILGMEPEEAIEEDHHLLPLEKCFVIAVDPNTDHIIIDLEENKKGMCYDGFHENYGHAGDMPIIALDFTELLKKLLQMKGEKIYWLETDFPAYGDAFDNQ